MAKRAIERFDAEASGKIIVGVDRESAHHAAEAIAMILSQGQMSNDALKVLRDALEASLQEAGD